MKKHQLKNLFKLSKPLWLFALFTLLLNNFYFLLVKYIRLNPMSFIKKIRNYYQSLFVAMKYLTICNKINQEIYLNYEKIR